MRELLRRLEAQRRLSAEVLVATLMITVLGLANTLFVMLVYNRYIPYGVDATLVTLAVGALIAVFAETALRRARRRVAESIAEAPDADLSRQVFATLTHGRLGAIDRLGQARRQAALGDLAVVERGLSADMLLAVIDVPFALLMVGAVMIIDIPLGFLCLAFVLAGVGVVRLGRRWIGFSSGSIQEADNAVQTAAFVALSSPETVRAFNAGGFLGQRWHACRDEAVRLRVSSMRSQTGMQSWLTVLGALQGITVISLGAVLVHTGQISLGTLIGANLLAGRALAPVLRLAQSGESMVKAEKALGRLRKFISTPMERNAGSVSNHFKGGVELADLSFGYPDSTGPLFEHLSLRLEPGEVLVVTGPNGSGKTSLARLLAGLLPPIRGQILADGSDLRQVAPQWWRRQLIYVPQEPVLLDATVAENIAVTLKEADADAVVDAARRAGLSHWLDNSAKGLDTPLAEGGRHLALGIRRRIALARAIVGGGKLALLDEPFEGLDNDGRAAFGQVIEDLMAARVTIVVFTHHPQRIRGRGWLLDLGVKPVPSMTRLMPGRQGEKSDVAASA